MLNGSVIYVSNNIVPFTKKQKSGRLYALSCVVNVPACGNHDKYALNPMHYKHTLKGLKGTVKVDEKKMNDAGKLDGFWLLVTNHIEKEGDSFNISAQQAIAPYREKVVIEAAFRDIKSFVNVAPVYVWTEAHVKAHYTICVLSHLINRTLTLRLHEHKGNLTKDIVSHEKLL